MPHNYELQNIDILKLLYFCKLYSQTINNKNVKKNKINTRLAYKILIHVTLMRLHNSVTDVLVILTRTTCLIEKY